MTDEKKELIIDTYDYAKSCIDGYSEDEARRRINAFLHRDVDCSFPTPEREGMSAVELELFLRNLDISPISDKIVIEGLSGIIAKSIIQHFSLPRDIELPEKIKNPREKSYKDESLNQFWIGKRLGFNEYHDKLLELNPQLQALDRANGQA